jgi:hypothetical protein
MWVIVRVVRSNPKWNPSKSNSQKFCYQSIKVFGVSFHPVLHIYILFAELSFQPFSELLHVQSLSRLKDVQRFKSFNVGVPFYIFAYFSFLIEHNATLQFFSF